MLSFASLHTIVHKARAGLFPKWHTAGLITAPHATRAAPGARRRQIGPEIQRLCAHFAKYSLFTLADRALISPKQAHNLVK